TSLLLTRLRAARPHARYLVACAGLLTMLVAPIGTFWRLGQESQTTAAANSGSASGAGSGWGSGASLAATMASRFADADGRFRRAANSPGAGVAAASVRAHGDATIASAMAHGSQAAPASIAASNSIANSISNANSISSSIWNGISNSMSSLI